jgi:hypothetical protein
MKDEEPQYNETANQHKLVKGYYFLQQVSAYYTSSFGAISTAYEASQLAGIVKRRLVSGVEYGPIYFHPEDISACISVARVFQNSGIDLWLTSAGLQKYIPAFNKDTFPEQYRAYSMTAAGSIVPATVWSLGSSDKVPAFDSMDPEAMAWFLDRYKSIYLEPMKSFTSGYFFNEDCLYYAMDPGHQNYNRIDYWELPAYSDSVLKSWQKYCIIHFVTYRGRVVTKFPVHSAAMVLNGGGKTEYFPGYNVPATVQSGSRIASIPRNIGVWDAWDDFVTSQYVKSWIGGISRAVHEVNGANPNFIGIIYFGLHDWSLAYEEVDDPAFTVDFIQRWVPWGTQRGVRLSKICELPTIDCVICETYPPIRANLDKFASEYERIVNEHNKTFGLMVHRDDDWGLDGKDTEIDRWSMIRHFQPTIIARYPINRLFRTDPYFDEGKEKLFNERLLDYRE